jgi:hypothetical protein
MTGIEGQASAEYAGLLALAAILGATLALIAGPPLVHGVRSALAAVLPGSAAQPTSVPAGAADIADVQAAVYGGQNALTPDAALLALARRHGRERASAISQALLLEAALDAAPWMRSPRTYRAWESFGDGPYREDVATIRGDRDVEHPTGLPVVAWITVAEQRRALASLFAYHASGAALVMDVLPGSGALKLFRGTRRLAQAAVDRLPRAADDVVTGNEVIDLIAADDDEVPPGARAGDVIVAWPAHRTFWRGGSELASASVDLGEGLGRRPAPHDYRHIVYFRPGPSGLRVIGEAFRA